MNVSLIGLKICSDHQNWDQFPCGRRLVAEPPFLNMILLRSLEILQT